MERLTLIKSKLDFSNGCILDTPGATGLRINRSWPERERETKYDSNSEQRARPLVRNFQIFFGRQPRTRSSIEVTSWRHVTPHAYGTGFFVFFRRSSEKHTNR